MVRCKKRTNKGKVCKRTAVVGKSFCWQHLPKNDKELEIWEKQGYPTPSKLLVKRKTNKIRTKLKNGPTKKDVKGYIYVYRLSTDNKENGYCKIGRTTQTVEKRLRQWSKDAILIKSFEVKHNQFCESLIHCYLDHWRVYRYKLKAGYCTVWKSTGEPVTKSDDKLLAKNKLEGRKKQIEWFCGNQKYCLEIVRAICGLDGN